MCFKIPPRSCDDNWTHFHHKIMEDNYWCYPLRKRILFTENPWMSGKCSEWTSVLCTFMDISLFSTEVYWWIGLTNMLSLTKFRLVTLSPVLLSWGQKRYINSFPGLMYYFWQQGEQTTCEHPHIFTTSNLSHIETAKSNLFHVYWPFTWNRLQTDTMSRKSLVWHKPMAKKLSVHFIKQQFVYYCSTTQMADHLKTATNSSVLHF